MAQHCQVAVCDHAGQRHRVRPVPTCTLCRDHLNWLTVQVVDEDPPVGAEDLEARVHGAGEAPTVLALADRPIGETKSEHYRVLCLGLFAPLEGPAFGKDVRHLGIHEGAAELDAVDSHVDQGPAT